MFENADISRESKTWRHIFRKKCYRKILEKEKLEILRNMLIYWQKN